MSDTEGVSQVTNEPAQHDPIDSLAGDQLPPVYGEEIPLTGAGALAMRERLGLSQVWCAEALGVARRTLIRWEASDEQVKPDHGGLLLALEREAADIALSLTEEVRAGLLSEVTIWRTEEGYREHVGGLYSAAWHRLIAARASAMLLDRAGADGTLTLVYAQSEVLPKSAVRTIRVFSALRRAATELGSLPGADQRHVDGVLRGSNPDPTMTYQRIRLLKGSVEREALTPEVLEAVRIADLAYEHAARRHAETGEWPKVVWAPELGQV